LPKAGKFDEIWISTRFTFEIPYVLGIVRDAKNRARRVLVGGIAATLLPAPFEREGVEVYKGLMPEAEGCPPDYTLLDEKPDYSISHTSRGCVRKCGFCMVPKLEPKFTHRKKWQDDLLPVSKRVYFYDNNWTAKKVRDQDEDIKKLRQLVAEGRIGEFDFNQGLDCRLMTEKLADKLAGLPLRPVRFAFDGMYEDGYYQKAVRLMAERGSRIFRTYVLYNFKDTPQDFYYRLRTSVELQVEIGAPVESFPMRYQPIMDIDRGRKYIGDHWTVAKKRGFMTVIAHQSGIGVVSSHTMEEFEYWFTENAKQFERLIAYPRINELMEKKAGALRMKRAQAV